jgi:hypothetical protein
LSASPWTLSRLRREIRNVLKFSKLPPIPMGL